MLDVIRRKLGLGGALLLLGLSSGAAGATAAEGPRLAYGQWGPGVFSVSLLSVDPLAASSVPIFRGHRQKRPTPLPFDSISWLPDGSAVAFTGLTGSFSGDGPSGSRIFLIGAEGGTPWGVAGTEGGMNPVVSPDGRSVAFVRTRERAQVTRRPREGSERAVSTWIVSLSGGAPRQLTPWRYGLEAIPSSFSPDGRTIAVTRVRNRRQVDVLALDVGSGGSTVVLQGAAQATFSPDGTEIAYLREGRRYEERRGNTTWTGWETDLFVRSLDGSRLARLTRTPRKVEAWPAWDPSGERLAFIQFGNTRNFIYTLGMGDSIVQINPDGTCRTKTLSWPDAALFGPAWQPGPGREAGRIAC
jgi:Tol biopolymer transport system component